jgi:hypothetical protein
MKKRYVVGIDPGVNTGVAWYDREEKRVYDFGTSDFWKVYGDFANETAWRFEVVVIIETPMKTRLYARQDVEQGQRRREKIAANAGGNSREAELLADGLEALGYEVIRQKPTRVKWDAEQLARFTGITKRTSQHARDAIALCYGF